MAIHDLLWCCPLCGAIEGIRKARGGGQCDRCGARFSRGIGASIVAKAADGVVERRPREWLDHLPHGDLDGEGYAMPAGVAPPYRQLVKARIATRFVPVNRGRELLGWMEQYGPKLGATLHADTERVRLVLPSGEERWSAVLDDLRSIQPASSSIQMSDATGTIISIKFVEGSVRLWEQRLKRLVRDAWIRAGRGEIEDFQPRIVAKAATFVRTPDAVANVRGPDISR